ncbi:MAG: DNA repair protein RecO [Planctomycetaceae bacterium]
MSAEKSDAIVLRMADFSESSRVVTLFTRDFGKVKALAKGAKRLKGPFESALDLLARVRVVFLRKSSDSLDLLTEAQLQRRFQPRPRELMATYGGYYVAELLDGLTEVHDPHPLLFDEAALSLEQLGSDLDLRLVIFRFEVVLLREVGFLPVFDACLVCGRPAELRDGLRYWVTQGGLICRECGRPEHGSTEVHPGTIDILQKLSEGAADSILQLQPSPQQVKELRRLLTSTISQALDRRPQMLAYLRF